jgi:hypothetical protein
MQFAFVYFSMQNVSHKFTVRVQTLLLINFESAAKDEACLGQCKHLLVEDHRKLQNMMDDDLSALQTGWQLPDSYRRFAADVPTVL